MNNEISKNVNNKKGENENKASFYKINIIKTTENPKEKEFETPKNEKQKNNRLLASPFVRRKKSDIDIKNILMSSFVSKRGEPSILVEKEQKIPKNMLKTKSLADNDLSLRIKDMGNNNPVRKRSAKKKNDNNNENDSLNLLKYTNNLFENDEHLNKDLIVKKININNNISKFNNNEIIVIGRNDKSFLNNKNKLIITLDLNEKVVSDNNLKLRNNSIKKKNLYKRQKSYNSKENNSNSLNKSKEKQNFSKFLNENKKNKSKKDINNSGALKKIYNNNDYKIIINNQNNNRKSNCSYNSLKIFKYNKDEDITSKNSKFFMSKAKPYQIKDNKDKNMVEDNKNYKEKVLNKKISLETNNNKINKIENINSNKNQEYNNIKKEDQGNSKKVKVNNKKCGFLCCLNFKRNDSEDL